MRIVGVIDEDAYLQFSAQLDVLERQKKIKSILVEVVSEGGSALVALAFVSRMRMSPIIINTLILGRAASAATLIAAAGAKRYMAKEAWAMVHEDTGEVTGTVTHIEAEVKQLRRMEDQWNGLLAKFSKGKVDAEFWTRLNATGDVHLTPEECLRAGLVDYVV